MMTIERRIQAFVKLGSFLSNFESKNGNFNHRIEDVIVSSNMHNGWFTEQNIRNSFRSIASLLSKKKLDLWTKRYTLRGGKKIAIIMAGNIPLVGFHDLLSVLISGHSALIKMSSDDNRLLPIIMDELLKIEPSFSDKIYFAKDKMENFDAVIATGSDNSARYFDCYFGKYPHIIRKTRNSVAILEGNETEQELEALAKDIFKYFGLGCRSVSKVFLPKNYDLNSLFQAFYPHRDVIENKKYANNYDYHKAIYMMGGHQFTENGFLIMKEEASLKSPVSVLHYEFYDSLDSVHSLVAENQENIQCVVGKGFTSFGSAQCPDLEDYADGINTLQFLEKI